MEVEGGRGETDGVLPPAVMEEKEEKKEEG